MALNPPKTPICLLLATLTAAGAVLPAVAAADDLPPDRRPLGAPPSPEEETSEPLILPPAPDEGAAMDAGRTEWSAGSATEVRREKRMDLVGAAYGAAGATAGFAGWFLLISTGQSAQEHRRGWRTAAAVAGGLSAAALTTGTVLWLTAPRADRAVAIAPHGAGAAVVVRF